MDIQKQQPKVQGRPGQDWLHCPVCQKRKVHTRRISGGMEVWTCTKCHNVQSYVYRREECEEDE